MAAHLEKQWGAAVTRSYSQQTAGGGQEAMTSRNGPLRMPLAAGLLVAVLSVPACAGEAAPGPPGLDWSEPDGPAFEQPALAGRGPQSSAPGSVYPGTANAACTDAKQAASIDLPYKYVGNNFSLKFHRPSCLFAKAMAPDHIELFHFRKQAVDAGMQPCRYCLPANWTTVRATLLTRPRRSESDPGGRQQ